MPKRQAPYYQHASQSTEGSTGQAGPSGSQDSIVANNRVFGRLISYASVTSASGQKAYYWIQSQPAANGAWADDSYGLACTAVASGQQTGYAWEVNGTSTLTANSIVELEYMGGVLDARGESWRIVLSSQGQSSFTLAGRTGTQTISSGDTMTLANGVVTATDTWTPDEASASLAGIVSTSTNQRLGSGHKRIDSLESVTFDATYGFGIFANGRPLASIDAGDYSIRSVGDSAYPQEYGFLAGEYSDLGIGGDGTWPTVGGHSGSAGNSVYLAFDFDDVTGGRLILASQIGSGLRYCVHTAGSVTTHEGVSGTGGGGDTVIGGIVTALGSALTGFTDELAQDAVGTILVDSATIDFTYNDGTPSITASAITQLSITADASGLKLSGDSASPGNSYYYGTNGAGTKGYYTLPPDYTADAELNAIAGLTSAADKGIMFTGSGTASVYDLTAAGLALLDDADASAQRTTLGLGTIATENIGVASFGPAAVASITVVNGIITAIS